MAHIFLSAILGPLYFLVGLSFIIYASVWMKLTKDFNKNHFHLLPIALGQFIIGMFIVLSHNAWEWSPWLIVTLTGWAMVLESVFYLLAPGDMIKSVLKAISNERFFQISGGTFLVLGLYLSYVVFV